METSLWEEKNYTEAKMSYENKTELELNDSTKKIKIESEITECEDIGSEKKWMKNCPKCGKEQVYTTQATLNKAIKLNGICRSCAFLGTNIIGLKFGKLTIINQYTGKDGRTLIDYSCECGTIKIGAHLTNVKNQKSCAKCQNIGKINKYRKPTGESAFNNLFNGYKQNAKIREYDFVLTKEQFKGLTKQNCFYCGKEPTQIFQYRRCNGEYIYNGIDRKDNTKGYTIENSVSCCKFCNWIKSDIPFDKFINWIRTVNKNTENIVMLIESDTMIESDTITER